MFEGFDSFSIAVSPDVTIRGRKCHPPSGSSAPLPPLLLLHGFPQTHHIWHRIAPKLTSRYTVIAPDLRGYGASSKPDFSLSAFSSPAEPAASGSYDVRAFAKSNLARDCLAVVDGLGFAGQPFFVCAHDRGARVAHKLAVDHPERVRAAILLDICPTLAMFEGTGRAFATAYWHWFFLSQPAPLPETMILGSGRRVAELMMGGGPLGGGQEIFDKECFEVYVRALEDPATVHAMCQDYRASATVDLDEAREDLRQGRKVKCPLLVLWGRHGVIEKLFDALKEWRAVTEEGVEGVAVTGHAVEAGHYIPEEVPDDVVAAILDFLV